MTIRHEEWLERLLVAYADGELEPDHRQAVEERLAADPALRQRLAEYRTSLAFVTQGLVFPPSADAPSLPQIRARVQRRRRRRAVLIASGAVTAVLLSFFAARRDAEPVAPAAPAAAVETDTDETDTARLELAALRRRIALIEGELARLRRAQREAAYERIVESVIARSQREEVAAIVVAAGANFESAFGDLSAALDRYRYVAEKFPETAAAETARAHITRIESAVERQRRGAMDATQEEVS